MLLVALLSSLIVAAFPGQQADWCRNLPRPEYKKLERVRVPDPWFEVYRIRPGVFAIYEPHQQEEVISYLITGNKRALLFDTGMGISDIRKLAEGLTSLPISVLNSHTHNDHVGDNWRFSQSQIYAMDTAFTRASALGSKEDAQAELTPDMLCGDLPAGFDKDAYSSHPFQIGHWLHDGDKIDLGGRALEIIATPGHTPDAIALLDRAHGLLFTGDSYYAGPIYLYRPETDLDAYVHSMEKLTVLAPKLTLLLPAHNVPVAQPTELARVLEGMRQVRSGKVKAVPHGSNCEYKFPGFSFLMDRSQCAAMQ